MKTAAILDSPAFARKALLIVVACAVVYWPSLGGTFIWDDRMSILENPAVSGTAGFREIWLEPASQPQYFPLTYSMFRLEHGLWGLDPLGYRLVNLLLHAANAVLLGTILVCLGVPGAWLGAALFALHPVQAETVAWISEGKNTLSMFLALLCLLAWPWRPATRDAADRSPEPRAAIPRYAAAFALFTMALLAKTAVAPLPLVVLAILWWRGTGIGRRDLIAAAALCVPAVLLGIMVIGREQIDVAWEGHRFAAGLAERFLLAGRAFWFYLGKMLLPIDLAFIYPRFEIDPGEWTAYLAPLAALLLFGALWGARRRFGRGIFAGASLYALGLAPFLGFVSFYFMRYSPVADHFQYHASAGLAALAAAAIVAVVAFGRRTASRATALSGLLFPVAILAALGALTFSRSFVFRDDESIWRNTTRRNPAALMAWNNLGNSLLSRGDAPGAVDVFRELLRRDPSYPSAHYNLGNALAAAGDGPAARETYELGLAIRPGDAALRNNLAAVLLRSGKVAEAADQWRVASRLDPGDPGIKANLGLALTLAGDPRGAAAAFRDALAIDPANPVAAMGLGMLGEEPGDTHATGAFPPPRQSPGN